VLWRLGGARHGDPGVYFDKWEAGTYVSSALLLACGVASGLLARRLPGPARRFWSMAAAGFAYLAYDEVFKVHERVDRRVHARLGLDPNHPVTDHLDDVIVMLYFVGAIALAWCFRALLLPLPWFVLPFTAALLTGKAMIGIDVATDLHAASEESLKLVTGALILVAILGALLDPELESRLGRES